MELSYTKKPALRYGPLLPACFASSTYSRWHILVENLLSIFSCSPCGSKFIPVLLSTNQRESVRSKPSSICSEKTLEGKLSKTNHLPYISSFYSENNHLQVFEEQSLRNVLGRQIKPALFVANLRRSICSKPYRICSEKTKEYFFTSLNQQLQTIVVLFW